MLLSWFLTSLIITFCFGKYEGDPSIVQTNYGAIQGKVSALARAFTKIPYGKPPLGDLRWEYPMRPDSWDGVLQTQADPPGCVQNCDLPWFACPTVVQEDCLYLNVFTPYHPNSTEEEMYPVMVFIHGGSFEVGYGGGLIYNGTDLANLTNVVMVSINYRLGALGFLWDNQVGLVGNYGYMDQVLALDWVYENIAAFGGDPNNIIIFGESAGATSVTLHVMNTSNTYIKGAIMESNPLGVPLRDQKTWGDMPATFETALGCDKATYPNPTQRLQCMKGVTDVKTLLFAQQAAIDVEAASAPKYFKNLFMPFTPTIGTDLFPKQPFLAFDSGEFLNIPIIIGTNRNESNIAYLSTPIDCNLEYVPFLEETYGDANAHKIAKFYNVPTTIGVYDCRNISVHVSTDSLFLCLSRNLTRNAVAYGASKGMKNVYFYHYNHVSSFSDIVYPDYPDCMYGSGGVCHEAELAYVFRPNLAPVNATYTPEEQQLARMIQWYWSSFSASKNPNTFASKDNSLNIQWEVYNNTLEGTIAFDIDKLTMVYNHDTQICEFWDSLGWTWIV